MCGIVGWKSKRKVDKNKIVKMANNGEGDPVKIDLAGIRFEKDDKEERKELEDIINRYFYDESVFVKKEFEDAQKSKKFKF